MNQQRHLSRRLALASVPALVLGATGCSLVQELPGLQRVPLIRHRRSTFANALYWVKGAEGATRTDVVWGRCAAMVSALNPDPYTDIFEPGLPAHWLSVLAATDPRIMSATGPFGPSGAQQIATVSRYGVTPQSLAVRETCADGSVLETVSWTDTEEVFPLLVDLLGDFYKEGEDGALRLTAQPHDLPAVGPGEPGFSTLIDLRAGRVVFDPAEDGVPLSEGESPQVDPRTAERLHLGHAAPLVDMLTVLGLDDAHIVRGAVIHGNPGAPGASGDHGNPGGVGAWLWASRVDATTRHTTRGCLRVADGTTGSAEALAARLQSLDTTGRALVITSITVEGQHVLVDVDTASSSASENWHDLPQFYSAMEDNPEAGIALAS